MGEKGPELEITGPARYYNADQTKGLLGGNSELIDEIKALRGNEDQTQVVAPGAAQVRGGKVLFQNQFKPDQAPEALRTLEAIYGKGTLADLEKLSQEAAAAIGTALVFRQSNHEGELVDWIQEARRQAGGLIINAGGYTHTSVAILDALNMIKQPIIDAVNDAAIFREQARAEFAQHDGPGRTVEQLALQQRLKLLDLGGCHRFSASAMDGTIFSALRPIRTGSGMTLSPLARTTDRKPAAAPNTAAGDGAARGFELR